MLIEFRVPVKPRPWQSPYYGTRAFSSPEMKAYQRAVKLYARQAYQGEPLTCAVKLTLAFYTEGRGDLTNYVKALEDAIQGVVFKNDRQVKELSAKLIKSPAECVVGKVEEL